MSQRASWSLESEKTVFDNGLALLFHARDQLPLISLNAFVMAGKDQNPLEAPGTASLVARMLDEGTQKFDFEELSELVENQGASLSTFSNRELTGISLQLRSSQLEKGFDILKELLCNPTFPAQRLEQERRKVLSHIQATQDEPPIVGSQLLNSVIYAGTPLEYPVLGTLDSLSCLTRKDLSLFHSTRYGPENTFIVVAGDAEGAAVRGLAEEYLGKWSKGQLQLQKPSRLERQSRPVVIEHPMDREQINIYLGHLGATRDTPDFYALQVMDIILGSGPGFTSRIPKHLRDEKGFAYTTYGDICGSAGRYPGRFTAFIATATEYREVALRGLRELIQDFLDEGPTQQELLRAQSFLTGNFVFEIQDNNSIVKLLLLMEMFQLGADYPSRFASLIQEIGREEVARVARKYLDTINYTTVLVGSIE